MAPRDSATAARDLGKDEHFAVGADRLEQRVLIDLAVDGHGHALVEMPRQRRVALGQQLEEVLHGRRREVELRDAARQLREIADQDHPRHGPADQAFLAPRSLSALSTFGGDIGSSVKRMPVAFSMALAIAAMGGTMGVSPTPRTP